MGDGVKTYIEGFDEIFETKTIPKASTIVVYGPMGSGKTTFVFDFIMKGIEHGDIGIFATIDEASHNLIRDFSRFKCWDLDKAFKERKLIMIDMVYPRILDPNKRKEYMLSKVLEGRASLEEFNISGDDEKLIIALAQPSDLIRLMDRENIVRILGPYVPEIEEHIKKGRIRFSLDSLTSYITTITREYVSRTSASTATHFEIEDVLRSQMLALKNRLEQNGITSFMTAEALSMERTRYGIEEFIARGVIYLGYDWVGSKRHRYLVVVKMRGRSHSLGKFGFEINPKNGIIVYGEMP